MKIRLLEHVILTKCRSDNTQKCISCGGLLKKGEKALSISKEVLSGNSINIWMHYQCLDSFYNNLKTQIKEKEKEIFVEML
jgi:hypothetical protein